MTDTRETLPLEDVKIPVRFKLFALWTSVTFFYIYGDYFELYKPGKLQEMFAGRMPLGAISQGVLLGMAAVMVIPCLMPFLSLVLPAGLNRWFNIVFGVLYTAIMILAIVCTWRLYMFFGLLEITQTLLIIRYAWTWPRRTTVPHP